MSNRKPIRRALISVYDKTGLEELGKTLNNAGVTILSTGSTAKTLMSFGIPVTPVEDYTGFPEMLDGRVKTLHPRIHAGLLADQNNDNHLSQLTEQNIEAFDLVVINLYPFAATIASGASFDECIEQIDIGGPSMLRGAAKNHGSVAVISDPSQYPALFMAIAHGGFSLTERQELALETFKKTSQYDSAISQWLTNQLGKPEYRERSWTKVSDLRYGENPHQTAALYRNADNAGLVGAEHLHGKAMSFNNYTDADAAWRAAWDHAQPCVAIIKHANPCGVATGTSIAEAYNKAHACDPVSAFGGVVAANREISVAMAEKLADVFTEVVVAPSYEVGAVEILSKKPSIRILQVKKFTTQKEEIKPILGGVLIQSVDTLNEAADCAENWQQVSGEKVSREQLADLEFAWRAVRAVKSNAIVCAKNGATVGIGMGQVNRVDSARLAVSRGGDRVKGSVAASDAFFPFADGLQILIDAGVTAIVQPGGSVRDAEVIAAAKSAGIAMFFTGVRHFSHS
jgi:phosphoribosylaminoimidazolecarboxamide formyltransferase/IMP cyclohydrolase